ncbi:glycoside hydrolase family 140 protein [Catalinimonas niigatensis]|uniref:glycoside hydrolase family 140 protein n=1 Tax=Catalinimonas niigatensis TaxID=1397264 RepID=UPI002665E7E3|nr:glycoside hydrolase family 140 protein [Catalinimonas niigatensis]WPP53249.1 glycoside hydrolase family 140 protein [Catalinimonas niigatensis]
MKCTTTLRLLLYMLLAGMNTSLLAQSLKVSDNKRYLIKEDGTPFFWLGDTAWELFHRLDREEATMYLEDRADKGFTVIQAVVLAELDGLNTPNPYGDSPLINNDPTQPNEAYFEHVDFIVDKAEDLGMYIGMLPTWGDKFNKRWGVGPEVFTPENARTYGEFLGERYKDKPIIWILGGDRIPEEEEDFAIIRAMAEGLANGDEDTHLMTYHPMGGRHSSEFFHEDEWLDFNMYQSGHGQKNTPNYEMTAHNYQLEPVKPNLDGEPNYEDHPINWKPENGWFDDADVRQAAYWSMLSGALGHTYGDHNIWQMWQEGREPISSARTPWKEAIDHPGSQQMEYMRQLFESRNFTELIPDPSLVVNAEGEDRHIAAARGSDFMMVYLPANSSVEVDAQKLSGKRINAWWFDPRTGDSVSLGKFKNNDSYTFRTPIATKDWVLVIDDANKAYTTPGEMLFGMNK